MPTEPATAQTDLGLFSSQNDFTISNGMITDGVYQIFGGAFDLNVANEFSTFASPDSETRVQNLLGFSAITFTPVPEPLTVALFGAGLVGLAVARRCRKKVLAS